MKHYWCERAWLGGGVASRVRLSVDHGRFTQIEEGVEPRDSDDVLRGLALPGAANGHSHTFHRALRGFGAPGGSFWSWRDTMYRIARALTPENYYRFAVAAYTEMMMAGYTAVGEFHYVHHQPDGQAYAPILAMEEALIAAAHDSGIRLTLLDTLYLSAGFGAPLAPEQIRFSDGDAASWRARMSRYSASSRVRIGAAIHSVRAVDADSMRTVASWARENDAPLHVHVSEQEKENAAALAHTGMTPVALLKAAGVWNAHATGVHATFLTDDDVVILGNARAFVCFCPTTEADLADGIGPAARLHHAGVRLTIGADQNVATDPFAEMSAVEMDQRLATGTREIFSPAELVTMMTANGYASLGWPSGGMITLGALADFTVIDTHHPRYAGVKPERLPLHAAAGDVMDTFVGGSHVYSRSGSLHLGVADTLQELIIELRERP